ncbi:MAG TPA: zinc ribbon domain-containing protein, partial [Gemmataceae bacterium]|nr:zinc ribbon domain-containing protein [Gemmataceae bacterium]
TIDTQARCPNCAELMVDPTAIICIYCGYNTLTRTYGKTKKVYAASSAEVLQHLLPAILFSLGFVFIIVYLVAYNTVLPPVYLGTPLEWRVHESVRMWSAMIHVGLLWWLGSMAYKTFVLQPMPKEIEKE